MTAFGVVGHSGAGPHLFACGSFIPAKRLTFIGALGPWGPVATPEIMASLNPLDRLCTRLSQRTPWIMRTSFAPLGWCARYWPRGAHEALIAYRDWGFDIETVRVPVHMWLGDQDIFVSREMGRYLERTIPAVDFHWIAGAGHFNIESWDDILAACATHI